MADFLPMVKRRAFFKSGLLALAAWRVAGGLSCAATKTTEALAEEAHQEIWRRFIDKRLDVLLHYVGLNGEVTLPTADHCAAAQPNGMSWSTPIEDSVLSPPGMDRSTEPLIRLDVEYLGSPDKQDCFSNPPPRSVNNDYVPPQIK